MLNKTLIVIPIIAITVGVMILALEHTNNDISQTLDYRTEKEIYQDLLSSDERTHAIMSDWGNLIIHGENDLKDALMSFELERSIQNSLYTEYIGLSDIYKTDEKIRDKFTDIGEHGPFPDQSFIESLKHQRDAELDFRITLEHNGCDNTCPVYSVSINGDGSVLYKGLTNVGVIGKQEYKIPREDITKLNEFLHDVYHGKTHNHYGLQDQAENIVITTIEFGQVKRITHYDNSGPESLKNFEDKIKEIALIDQFILTEKQS